MSPCPASGDVLTMIDRSPNMELFVAAPDLTAEACPAADVVERYLETLPLVASDRAALLAQCMVRVAAEGSRDDPATRYDAARDARGARARPRPGLCVRAAAPGACIRPQGGRRPRRGPQAPAPARQHATDPPHADGAAPLVLVGAAPKRPSDVREHAPDTLAHETERQPWQRAASFRRVALSGLVVAQTWLAASFMSTILPYHGRHPLELALVALFAILFAWMSAGFWTAIAGFVIRWARGDRFAITRTLGAEAALAPLPPQCGSRSSCRSPTRTSRASSPACARPTTRSHARTTLAHFDFFVLSDTADPDTRVAERRGVARALPARSMASAASSTAGAQTSDQAQERQRRRFLPALGRATTATWSCSTPTA